MCIRDSDAFLVEWDQLSDILREALAQARPLEEVPQLAVGA